MAEDLFDIKVRVLFAVLDALGEPFAADRAVQMLKKRWKKICLKPL